MRNNITIHRVVKNTKDTNQYIEEHSHAFFHYIYGLSGTQNVTVGGRRVTAGSGSLVLVQPGVMHSVVSVDKSTSIDLKFVCSEELTERLRSLPVFIDKVGENTGRLIMNLLEEAVTQEPGYEEMADLYMYQILICIMRGFSPAAGNLKTGMGSVTAYSEPENAEIVKILRVIEDGIYKPLKVKRLADISGYSENYFRIFFKKEVGVNPNRYINERKIAAARELMLRSDLNISQISERLGFQNIQYFSRVFKKYMGAAPRDYMERMNGNRPINLVHTENTPLTEFEFPLRDPDITE